MAFPSTSYRNDGPDDISRYIARIREIPLLSHDEEFELAKKWRENGDRKAIDRLLASHLRLVAKVAMGYRGYGMPLSDLIAEGNIGMMHAIKHYDPQRGFRFSTYAMWWIKASIQDYVLRSWSLVKIGTTSAQKRLFFNLRKTRKSGPANESDFDLSPEMVAHIATKLGVKEEEVRQMNQRLAGADHSLNVAVKSDGQGESEWIDWLADDSDNQEIALMQRDEIAKRMALLDKAMDCLSERERLIIIDRRLTDPPHTLEDLSEKYTISRERVRQVEVIAFEKLQRAIKRLSTSSSYNHV
ncbi:MAG: RNA polymerase sigma factor RpoH [Alphaproteobacteria bacterium]